MSPATRADLFQRLAALGIATRTVEHEAVFTVAESAASIARFPAATPRTCF